MIVWLLVAVVAAFVAGTLVGMYLLTEQPTRVLMTPPGPWITSTGGVQTHVKQPAPLGAVCTCTQCQTSHQP